MSEKSLAEWLDYWCKEIPISNDELATEFGRNILTVRRWRDGFSTPRSKEEHSRLLGFMKGRGATSGPSFYRGKPESMEKVLVSIHFLEELSKQGIESVSTHDLQWLGSLGEPFVSAEGEIAIEHYEVIARMLIAKIKN